MLRFTLASVTLAILLLCGSTSPMAAQGDTKIVVGDSSSILIWLAGLDNGSNWSQNTNEIKHKVASGMLRSLTVTDNAANKCPSGATCGIDVTRPWNITIKYGQGTLVISSVSANQGLHLQQTNIATFDRWQKTNTDERVFGHGTGVHIQSISVNNGGNLCGGQGKCEIAASYH